jgi:hypothetical protein
MVSRLEQRPSVTGRPMPVVNAVKLEKKKA